MELLESLGATLHGAHRLHVHAGVLNMNHLDLEVHPGVGHLLNLVLIQLLPLQGHQGDCSDAGRWARTHEEIEGTC